MHGSRLSLWYRHQSPPAEKSNCDILKIYTVYYTLIFQYQVGVFLLVVSLFVDGGRSNVTTGDTLFHIVV